MSLSHCAGSVLVKGLKTSQPALLTSTSIGPSDFCGLDDGRVDAGALGDVAAEGLRAAAFGPDAGGDLLGRIEVEVEDGDLGALARRSAGRWPRRCRRHLR